MDGLGNSSMKPGQDLEDFFMRNVLSRSEVAKKGGHKRDFRLKKTLFEANTADDRDIGSS